MSKYPDNDGKEAIEMADLSAPSPAGHKSGHVRRRPYDYFCLDKT